MGCRYNTHIVRLKGRFTVEHEVQKIVSWLQKKVQDTGAKGLVVGVSGGLDSAVVAYLIKRAFPNDSLGVVMPIHSNEEDIKDAYSVVEQGQLTYATADLTSTHEKHLQAVIESNKKFEQTESDLMRMTDANLRARIRMSTLYTYATLHQYLVVGTDNKSEWYTGYFTKYGDGGVDILPIVDYTKSEIWEMAAYLGVPQEVINKMPSADLWEGQTDEEEMGTTYTHIDAYLDGKDVPKEDAIKIRSMHERTAHKRSIPAQFIRP